MEGKRKWEDDGANLAIQVVKKQKTDSDNAIVIHSDKGKEIMPGVIRTSNLQAPTVLLEGHKAAIHTVKFDPTGQNLATGSSDKSILLWKVYGDNANYMSLQGHTNAVLELHWFLDGTYIISASADKTVAYWDAQTGQRIRKFTEHSRVVHTCAPSHEKDSNLLISGSDDNTSKIWDSRAKRSVCTLPHKFQVTSVSFASNDKQIFTGGLDNIIRIWDLHTQTVTTECTDHTDIVTSLSLSPSGTHLLSNSMDNTVRLWDVRPYVSGDSRCVGIFHGAVHGIDKNLLKCSWSNDGTKVTAGSADRFVYVWDVESGQMMYKLPGHLGTVNEVAFSPVEPIIASASEDKKIYLGEIEQ